MAQPCLIVINIAPSLPTEWYLMARRCQEISEEGIVHGSQLALTDIPSPSGLWSLPLSLLLPLQL